MSNEWYYLLNGEECGPVPATQLAQLVAAGTLQLTDLTWRNIQVRRSPQLKFLIANVVEQSPQIGNQPLTSVVARGRLFGGGISTGHWPDTCEAYREATYLGLIAVTIQAARNHPGSPKHTFYLASCYFDLGLLCQGGKRFQQAAWAFEEAHTLSEQLVQSWPSKVEHHKLLAASYNQRGLLNLDCGDLEEAQVSIEKAIALRTKLLQDDPADIITAVLLGGAHCNLGTVLCERERFPKALEEYEQAIRLVDVEITKLKRGRLSGIWDWLLRRRARRKSLASTAETYLANTQAAKARILEQLGR